jgi:hypothetical protein
MTDDESGDEELSLLSDSDLRSLLSRLQGSHSSSFQSIMLIRRLLASVSNPAIVIGAIPKIIQCSSSEFGELYPSFASLLERDPFSAAPLLDIMGSFDYEAEVKSLAYALALNLLERIEADRLPALVSQVLFVAPGASIPDIYAKFKEIFEVHAALSLYKSFEVGARPHLSRFFQCVRRASRWQFLDFFVVLLSLSRPSLRQNVAALVWQALLGQRLSAPRLGRFLARVDVLAPYSPASIRFFEMVITSIPRFIHWTALNPIVSFALAIIATYPESASVLINQLISYVLEAPSFAASVAVSALLSLDPELLSSQSTILDDLYHRAGPFTPPPFTRFAKSLPRQRRRHIAR